MEHMMNINPNNVIGDCLENAFGLKTYMRIMQNASADDFSATPEFRKLFNGFYKVQRKTQKWYDRYYELMEEQRIKSRSFSEILVELNSINPSVEASFASKLIATINPDFPIWDQYVLRNLGFEREWEKYRSCSADARIEKAVEIYEIIQSLYSEFELSAEGKACIAAIDSALPMYAEKLSNTKKIDFILWSKRC